MICKPYRFSMRAWRERRSSGISSVTVFHTTSESMSKYPCMSLFLMPTIDAQGTPGGAPYVSLVTLLAASPTTSIARTTAKRSIRSVSRSPRFFWTLAYLSDSLFNRNRKTPDGDGAIDVHCLRSRHPGAARPPRCTVSITTMDACPASPYIV
jgi:hypothetical protein